MKAVDLLLWGAIVVTMVGLSLAFDRPRPSAHRAAAPAGPSASR